jgi:DNA adenine methylase
MREESTNNGSNQEPIGLLKAPFPYFGGKSRVAEKVWYALGNPKHYIEPFFGSGAVLLARPSLGASDIESVCDKDGFLANVWRSLCFSPDETAKWCDWPVNHADLSARKLKLIANEDRLLENLVKDDEWHDPKLAGYWIWAASCWIGSGLTRLGQIPHLSSAGIGVHAIGKRPHLGSAGMGVHAASSRIYDWFGMLSKRLRRVRVVCGDWTRVCGGNWQDGFGTCGIFFDPPYGVEDRDAKVYHHDSIVIAKDVMEWCAERGKLKSYKIVIAGYEEHMPLVESHGWRFENWTAQGGYSNLGGENKNRKRECLYYSPHCIVNQPNLF